MNFYKKYQSIRKEKGFTIEDISNHTKIDGKYFILIEKGKFAEISPVYLKLFFKAYVNFLNLEEKECLEDLDDFMNSPSTDNKIRRNNKENFLQNNNITKASTFLTSQNLLNRNIFFGIILILLIFLFPFLNSKDDESYDYKSELRLTNQSLSQNYQIRFNEISSIVDIKLPVKIRIISKEENYISFNRFLNLEEDNSEYFITQSNINKKANTLLFSWDEADSLLFLIANPSKLEFSMFSDDYFNDLSSNILNDFPVKILLKKNPFSLTISKYIPNR
jgi:cytoskeletal protein RodZ